MFCNIWIYVYRGAFGIKADTKRSGAKDANVVNGVSESAVGKVLSTLIILIANLATLPLIHLKMALNISTPVDSTTNCF
ncbi:hypothetical protein BCD_1126 (plasmid) [Borrelia crocidurae DOU]|uniref:Uncharacterized protein n=1 Tax=Borrelia crocidurae DOU TaxID=1293575 RepID=W5SJS2_9SPIR|nr:hypothetical protein BCD_1126 [Borrelia crocidurae DOU]